MPWGLEIAQVVCMFRRVCDFHRARKQVAGEWNGPDRV